MQEHRPIELPEIISEANLLTEEERRSIPARIRRLLASAAEIRDPGRDVRLREIMAEGGRRGVFDRDRFGISGLIR